MQVVFWALFPAPLSPQTNKDVFLGANDRRPVFSLSAGGWCSTLPVPQKTRALVQRRQPDPQKNSVTCHKNTCTRGIGAVGRGRRLRNEYPALFSIESGHLRLFFTNSPLVFFTNCIVGWFFTGSFGSFC